MHLEGYEWIIYFFSMLSVALLGTFYAKHSTSKLSRKKLLIVKKICLAVFIVTSIYWIITFPYIGSYYNFADKSDLPANISVEKQSDFIRENRLQIESLERELKETTDDLEAVTGRINLLLQLIMFALIYFGTSWIFTPDKSISEEDHTKLNLDL